LGDRNPKEGTYFAFFAFSALIFAHHAFAFWEILARTAADIVRLPLVTVGLLVCPDDTDAVLTPFNAAMALLTAANCRCSFASSWFNAPIMSMKPPHNIRHWTPLGYKVVASVVLMNRASERWLVQPTISTTSETNHKDRCPVGRKASG